MTQPATTGDERIRCLTCTYNLTGVTSNRCPECGAPFNRKKLLRDAYLGKGPIPYWSDRRDQNVLLCLMRTIAFVIFSPRQVVTRLPNRPDYHEARSFSRHCYTLAAILVIVPLFAKPVVIVGAFPLVVGALWGALVCQLLVTTVILQANQYESPNADRAFAYSESLGCLFAAHIPVTAIAVGALEMFGKVLDYPTTSPLVVGSMIAIGISVLWWIIDLGIATWSLESRVSEAVGALLTLPFLLVIASFVGTFTATMLMLFLALFVSIFH